MLKSLPGSLLKAPEVQVYGKDWTIKLNFLTWDPVFKWCDWPELPFCPILCVMANIQCKREQSSFTMSIQPSIMYCDKQKITSRRGTWDEPELEKPQLFTSCLSFIFLLILVWDKLRLLWESAKFYTKEVRQCCLLVYSVGEQINTCIINMATSCGLESVNGNE